MAKTKTSANKNISEDFEDEFKVLRGTYLNLSDQINTFINQIESLEEDRKNVMKKITTLQKK